MILYLLSNPSEWKGDAMKSRPSRLPRPRSVVECFEGLPDPRLDRTRVHRLTNILVIGLCSMLTVGEGFTDIRVRMGSELK